MSTSPALHSMSDAASVGFSRLVACPFPACNGGDVDGQPCERCGGEGRVAPPPSLPAMPKPVVVKAANVRREYTPSFYRYGMRVSGVGILRPDEPTFLVRRFDADSGETGEVEVWADELTPDEVAAMPAEARALAEQWRDVADVRDAEPTLNGEARAETVAECQSEAAIAAE